jgi:DNA helicase HerA-like ATPase
VVSLILWLLRKLKITPFSTFLDSLDKNSFINALTDSSEILVCHIGIFGNTGSGKSYTLAKIYRQLFEEYKNNENFKNKAKFIIIDFNGEYIDDAIIDEKGKNSYDLTTKATEENDEREKLPISKSTIENATFWSFNIFNI